MLIRRPLFACLALGLAVSLTACGDDNEVQSNAGTGGVGGKGGTSSMGGSGGAVAGAGASLAALLAERRRCGHWGRCARCGWRRGTAGSASSNSPPDKIRSVEINWNAAHRRRLDEYARWTAG
jgi:hypothetical protein